MKKSWNHLPEIAPETKLYELVEELAKFQSYPPEILHTIVKNIPRGIPLKDYIEERAVSIANYITGTATRTL